MNHLWHTDLNVFGVVDVTESQAGQFPDKLFGVVEVWHLTLPLRCRHGDPAEKWEISGDKLNI